MVGGDVEVCVPRMVCLLHLSAGGRESPTELGLGHHPGSSLGTGLVLLPVGLVLVPSS